MASKDVPSHPVEAAAEEAQQPQKGVLGTIKEALGLGVGGAGGGAASESKTVEAEVKERVEAEAPGTPGGASPVCLPSKARDPALKLAVGVGVAGQLVRVQLAARLPCGASRASTPTDIHPPPPQYPSA